MKIDVYLPAAYGSGEFRTAYEAAVNPPKTLPTSNAVNGTFNHVIIQYLASRDFKCLADTIRRSKRERLDWIRNLIGKARLADIENYHLEAIMDRKGSPWAADRLHKDMGEIYRFATRKHGFDGVAPTENVQRNSLPNTGHHTWTIEQVRQYRDHHPSGTMARLALEVCLGTCAARRGACKMNRSNIKGPNTWYRRGKTGQDVTLPIRFLPELQIELRQLPHGSSLSFTHSDGKPYTVESFGNWFADQRKAAHLPSVCRAHGLRKMGATRLAEFGAAEFQIMAFLAHKTPHEAQ